MYCWVILPFFWYLLFLWIFYFSPLPFPRIVRGEGERGGMKISTHIFKTVVSNICGNLDTRLGWRRITQCLGCPSLACGLSRIFYSRTSCWTVIVVRKCWRIGWRKAENFITTKIISHLSLRQVDGNVDSSLEQVCIMSSKQSLNFKVQKNISQYKSISATQS